MRALVWISGLAAIFAASEAVTEVSPPDPLVPLLPSEQMRPVTPAILPQLSSAKPATAQSTPAKPTPAETSALIPDPNPADIAPRAPDKQNHTPLTPKEFTFKRIAVPEPGQRKRITIQIDPTAQAAAIAALPAWEKRPSIGGGTGPRAPSAYDWYWQMVSPTLGDKIGRVPTALDALTRGPAGTAVPAPRLAALQGISALYGKEILAATIGTEVSPALVLAVISVESGGQPQAVSHAGAVGLMQLIPATATRFNVADSTDPRQNIKGGVAYLDWLMKEFDRDPLMVIAAYNAGENAVKSANGVPDFAETRAYVPKVLAAWEVARGLCRTRPELVTDGCVFAIEG